jgi:hypothetical protein
MPKVIYDKMFNYPLLYTTCACSLQTSHSVTPKGS